MCCRCKVILFLRMSPVSPMYCFLHPVQVRQYIKFLEVHENSCFKWKVFLALWNVRAETMGILGHVLHLLSVQFIVPPLLVVRDALVNNFFKFGGCRLLGISLQVRKMWAVSESLESRSIVSLILGEKLPFDGLWVKTKGNVSFSLDLDFSLRKSSMSIFSALSIPALINFGG